MSKGIKAFIQKLEEGDNREDLFEFDARKNWYGFPCVVCKHRHRDPKDCEECRHFAR